MNIFKLVLFLSLLISSMNISSKENIWSCLVGGKPILTEDATEIEKVFGKHYLLELHIYNFSDNYETKYWTVGENKKNAESFLETILSEERSPIYTRIKESREDELGIIITLEDKEDMDSVLEMEIRKDFPGAKTGKAMYLNEGEDITNECYKTENP